MDTLRLVQLDQATQSPYAVLDLNSHDTLIRQARDAFTPIPPAKRQVQVAQTGRFGGQQTVDETHDNGSVSSRFLVLDSTPQQAMAKIEDLLAAVDSERRGRYLEWTPELLGSPTLFELRGPGTYSPQYKWVMWRQNNALEVELSWPVAPLARGLPMQAADNFWYRHPDGMFSSFALTGYSSTDFSTWSMFEGEDTLTRGQRLVATDTTVKDMVHIERGYDYGDAEVMLMFLVLDSADTTPELQIKLKSFDIDSGLLGGFDGAGNLRLWKQENGALTTIGSPVAVGALSTGDQDPHALRFRMQGDAAIVEYFAPGVSPPVWGGTPSNTLLALLTGADQTTFGKGAQGKAGLRWAPAVPTGASSGVAVTGWQIHPYVYRAATTPQKIELGGPIPGTAPAECYVDVSAPSGDPLQKFMLLGLAPRPQNTAYQAPQHLFDSSANSADLNTTQITHASAHGGNYRGRAVSAVAAESWVEWAFNPLAVAPDPFTEHELALEVWARLVLPDDPIDLRFVASAYPTQVGLSTVPPMTYTSEYGSRGKLVVRPSVGPEFRFERLGTLVLSSIGDGSAYAQWKMRVAAVYTSAPGAGDNYGIDYMILWPAARRAVSPTDRSSVGYPSFFDVLNHPKRVFADGRGAWLMRDTSLMPVDHPVPAPGLGAGRLEVEPGLADLLVKSSTRVPGDPASSSSGDLVSQTLSLRLGVTPRYRLARF